MSVNEKKVATPKKSRKRILTGIVIIGIPIYIGLIILLYRLPVESMRVEWYLEDKYGIEFEVEQITDHECKEPPFDRLYFCHPEDDESLKFCVYEEGWTWKDEFIEQAVVRELEQNIKTDFEELGIDVTLECSVGNYTTVHENQRPWKDENNYQMSLNEFLNKYSEENLFVAYIIIRKSDIVDGAGQPDLELIGDLLMKYSEKTSSDVCFQMLFASDEMYERFDKVFAECPMVIHYKGYGDIETRKYAVTMVANYERGYVNGTIEGYYKTYYWRKDWEDKIILKE